MNRSSDTRSIDATPAGEESSPSLSFQAIQESCASYFADCRQQDCPDLKLYVDRVDAHAQPTLLRNLLHHDLRRRRARGESPRVDDYTGTMPEHAAVVRSVFFESTTGLASAVAETGDGPLPHAAESPLALPNVDLLGNYRLLRELGRGGMGMVFEAQHLQRGHSVALKTLPAVDGASLHSFKQEFRRMAEINHPNLIGLNSLEEDHGHWYFTMDLIRGTDFYSYVRPQGAVDEPRLRSALAQLAAAVLTLHGAGLIHRDLKPSNVMVTLDGRVVVLDFGLAYQRRGSNETSVAGTAGTPAYMAPEQAIEGSVTGAADWYSVGVMLYEALSGRRPFSGSSGLEVLLKKSRDAAPLLLVDVETRRDLIELANQLLSRVPEARPGPLQIARTLSAGASTVASAPRGGSPAVLVGRHTQLQQLTEAFKQTGRSTRTEIVFVSGRSGEGKTALVESFLHGLKSQSFEFVPLAGRCYDRESVPFKALDSLLDALAGYLRKLPDRDAALMMPDDITFLAKLFPVLRRVAVVSQMTEKLDPDLDQQQVRMRAFAALRSLLRRVTIQLPVILFADDLQWGDMDSAEALFEVLKPPGAPTVLLIGSFRTEEVDRSPFLMKWRELTIDFADLHGRSVQVMPLTVDECVQLAVMTAGHDSEHLRIIAQDFARQTGGNALLLTELLSCFDPASNSFRVMPIHEVIQSKLDRLPSEAVSLLEAIAVSGQSLRLEEVARAAGVEQTANSVITHMRSEKLVRWIGDEQETSVDTFHDKIRETVLAQMTAERRMRLHGALARSILASLRPSSRTDEIAAAGSDQLETDDSMLAERVFDLSYHFDGAGEKSSASHYAVLAAERAASQFSQRAAADQYTIASRNADKSDTIAQFRIAQGAGRALTLLGDYSAALQSLDGAIALTDDSLEQARVLGLLAEIAHKQGKIQRGIELYSDALRRLGYFVPNNTPALVVALARETFVQMIHTYVPRRLYQRQRSLSPAEQLAVELANRNSIVSYYSNVLRMIWTHLKGLNLAETRQPSIQLAYSYGLHPAPVSAIGLSARGLRFNDEAIKIASSSSDLLTQGHCFVMRSMAHYAGGQHELAVQSARQSIELLQRVGDPYLIFIAASHLSFSSNRLALVELAISTAATGFERSIRLGEQASAAGMLLAWTLATDGELPFTELRACFDVDPTDHFSKCLTEVAEGVWHYHNGRFVESIDTLERMWSRARRQLVIVPYTVAGLGWLITAIRSHAMALPAGQVQQRSKLIKKAWAQMRQLRVLSLMYPCERPRAMRELGLLLSLSGNQGRGLKQIRSSMDLAEQHGDILQHALSAKECGLLEQQTGDPQGAARVIAAQATLDRIVCEIKAQSTIRSPAEPVDAMA